MQKSSFVAGIELAGSRCLTCKIGRLSHSNTPTSVPNFLDFQFETDYSETPHQCRLQGGVTNLDFQGGDTSLLATLMSGVTNLKQFFLVKFILFFSFSQIFRYDTNPKQKFSKFGREGSLIPIFRGVTLVCGDTNVVFHCIKNCMLDF